MRMAASGSDLRLMSWSTPTTRSRWSIMGTTSMDLARYPYFSSKAARLKEKGRSPGISYTSSSTRGSPVWATYPAMLVWSRGRVKSGDGRSGRVSFWERRKWSRSVPSPSSSTR
ncbi:MAG: hypothetical protein AMXMBFR53_01440 [Gemmatimonadota bacterium]